MKRFRWYRHLNGGYWEKIQIISPTTGKVSDFNWKRVEEFTDLSQPMQVAHTTGLKYIIHCEDWN